MQSKKRGRDSRENTGIRPRTRSKPRERNLNEKEFEFSLARENNLKIYKRLKNMYKNDQESKFKIRKMVYVSRLYVTNGH